MLSHLSAPASALDAIVFDCDGTLSRIEGIDELARNNDVGEQVSRLTEEAMGKTGLNPALYQKRLDLVLPTRSQVDALGQLYFEQKAPDLLPVLQQFVALGKTIYIISAGLLPAVAQFGQLLGVQKDHIFAVDIYFDDQGNYKDFDRNSPLVNELGKRKVVEHIKQQHAQLAYVGDGLNDYETHDLVTRFIGYGGVFYRKNIEERCEYYITANSMAPLLPLCLTADECARLAPVGQALYEKGYASTQKAL